MSSSAPHGGSAAVLSDQSMAVLRARIAACVAAAGGTGQAARTAILAELRAELDRGRAEAKQLLIDKKDGMACARLLSARMDELIAAIYDYVTHHLYLADNPSQSERIAIVAVGGYGRGTLAPGSDVDLLFLLPYKQTAWVESVVEAMLYLLWDLRLKVGHSTRSIDDCVREAKADMTVRTALLETRFLLGNEALYAELEKRYEKDVVDGTAAAFVQAKLSEREARVMRKIGRAHV